MTGVITINGRAVPVSAGMTVLDAAGRLGIEIPTMCHLPGAPHFTSCMVCVVKDKGTGRLIPACSAPATDGMVVETEGGEIHHARKSALDLLLSEHVGDCEAPCRLTCPAHMNIPLMTRQMADGQFRDALATVRRDIALPGVLGRICPAPCEKACRRSRFDSAVAICLLKRFCADQDAVSETPLVPVQKPATGKKVAIIGAGPAGLAAAFYLAQEGHACVVLDERAEPGGQLRYGVPESRLPGAVLDHDLDVIRNLGVVFRMKTAVGRDLGLALLKQEYDAIVLAPGRLDAQRAVEFGVDADEKGVKVDPHSHRTSDPQVFAGGEVVQAGHLAVRACGQGKTMAVSVGQYLAGQAVTGPARRFDSRLGKLLEGEIGELMKEADAAPGLEPAGGASLGFSVEEVLKESRRCMHCDCRKAESCKLRDLAGVYAASQKHFNVEGRKAFQRIVTHASVVFEPGKCIKCGICVRITERAGEPYGMTFMGRGFDSVLGVPFNEPLGAGLRQTAEECVAKCPTGALALKRATGTSPILA